MQRITAIIKPHRLDDVQSALRAGGVNGMTVTEVNGFGRQGGHTETYRGTEYAIAFVPKIRVDVLCDDAVTDALVDAIAAAAKTGSIGDGKIWTTTVNRLVRIRTGEEGPDAV
jgi:nitrogen regulatory protein P-II 1